MSEHTSAAEAQVIEEPAAMAPEVQADLAPEPAVAPTPEPAVAPSLEPAPAPAEAVDSPAVAALAEGMVEAEFSRSVSFWVNSVEHSFPAGKNVLPLELLTTIKQTHLADAVK